MVIERALEKMRQSAAATPAQVAPLAHPMNAAVERRRDAPSEVRVVAKPSFKRLPIDRKIAEECRILLPDTAEGATSAAAASYRMLRTRFLQRLRSNHWTSLAITSPGAGEGKSVTALNLALSIARDKSCDVFLLDLDMRNPSICRYLGAQPERELLSYFAGIGDPADALFSIGVDNLAIGGSVTPSAQASELIANPRLTELLGYIRGIAANPVVIVDVPPLLVTDEALLVAPRVDATALVVAEGRTRRDSLARARQLLADFTFAGVILNCSSQNYGADSYYGYGYGYRYHDPKA
jgi:protein-tyrosine kinase